jgi:hypothetical protein
MDKNEQMGQLVIFLIVLIFRIYALFHCSEKAKALNRSSNLWGFFGFSAPILAMIWISYKKPIIKWEENIELETEESKTIINENQIIEPKEPIIQSKQEVNPQKKQSPTKPENTNDYGFKKPILKKIDRSSDRY